MVVTGSYYGYWSKRYDVTGDCAELATIAAAWYAKSNPNSQSRPLPSSAIFTPENMTVAYLGDSGVKPDSLDVLRLVKCIFLFWYPS